MKLALVRQAYNPYGGAERFLERAMSALIAEGVDVTLITRRWAGEETTSGFAIRRCDTPLPLLPRLLSRRLARDLAFAACVHTELARGGYDLVQSHERIPGCHIYRAGDGVHAAWLKHRARAGGGLRRRLQALDPYHRYLLRAEARMFAHPQLRAVICNSLLVRDEIVAHFGIAADKLHVVHNGVDQQRFHPRLRARHRADVRRAHGIPDQAPLFLFVGSGFERKGVSALLQSFARPAFHDARLAIVGADRHQRRYMRQAAALGVGARAHFVGAVRDVAPWYGAADCFVLPTLYDPFPNAALEAFSCGLPVVTSTTCGAAELASEDDCVWVADALDVDGVAAGMARAIALAPAADELRRRREPALAGFTLDALANRLLGIYRSLLGP